jgi:hypothetical protein
MIVVVGGIVVVDFLLVVVEELEAFESVTSVSFAMEVLVALIDVVVSVMN